MRSPVLLYVEDDEATVFILEAALKEARIQVDLRHVSDGEKAIKLLRSAETDPEAPKPDLIILDLNLPRRTGFEVLAEIKQSSVLQTVPVVVLTSSSLAADKNRSMALGAQEYLVKPSSFNDLIETVKGACSYLPSWRAANSVSDRPEQI